MGWEGRLSHLGCCEILHQRQRPNAVRDTLLLWGLHAQAGGQETKSPHPLSLSVIEGWTGGRRLRGMRDTLGTFRLENMTVLFQVHSEKMFFSLKWLWIQRAGTAACGHRDASLALV